MYLFDNNFGLFYSGNELTGDFNIVRHDIMLRKGVDEKITNSLL